MIVSYPVGIISFLIAVIVSRILNEKAMKKLSQEDKARLIDSFSGMRAYGFIPVVLIIIIYFLIVEFTAIDGAVLHIGYIVLLLLFIIGMQSFIYNKLTKLNFPKEYIKVFNVSRIIYFVGIGLLVAALLPQ